MNSPTGDSGLAGLPAAEARRRLAQDGYNELPSARPRSGLAIALGVVREPMFLLLLAAAAIYLVLGDLREALVLAASVLVMIGITFVQERKTERALEALRELSSPRALVIRGGATQRIAGRELVRGDIVMLKEGDRVPADAIVRSCNDLMADESLLTGESLTVRKRPAVAGDTVAAPGGDDLPYVFSGTLLTQGSGIAEVLATGPRTEIGRIGKALQTLPTEASPIQIETRRAVLIFAAIGLGLCLLVVILYGLLRGDWLQGLLAGVTLAMAILPEEFPVVLTVFLALGALRISRQGVLTRRAPAIEALGATTVLCVDKTGTLTENRMAVRKLDVDGEMLDVDDKTDAHLADRFHDLVIYSVLASEVDPFDPMEKAFHDFGHRTLDHELKQHAAWTIAAEYPLASSLLAHSHLWQTDVHGLYTLAMKGAPETVADLCRLDEAPRRALAKRIDAMAADGLRVLAVARAKLVAEDGSAVAWPTSQRDFDLEFLGLMGLADPVRAGVPAALRECYSAGIRTVMITGDYPGTARAVAGQIGLKNAGDVVTGPELAAMTDAELTARIGSVNIFARVVPEQKLRIVTALKAAGEVVAMTGDGVNDAPALKAAHIGIAMGRRGTDVAREAAALVLIDDDFASIVHAVRLGRRIYDNIQKAMRYILAVHVPTAGIALLPLLFGWPLVLFPVHVVFLEFVIDPACSIAFEAEPAERNVMHRPPRRPDSRLLDGWTVISSLAQGLAVLVAATGLYALVLHEGLAEATARAMVFSAIVLGNVGLILANRSRHRGVLAALLSPNPALWWVTGGALGGLALVLYVPSLAALFRFAPLGATALGASILAAVGGLAVYEMFKRNLPMVRKAQ